MVIKPVRSVRKGERDYGGKGKFWVWSGTELEWCIVKVVVMMMMIMMMMNWWEKDKDGSDRFAKFFRNFIPETRWGMAESAVLTFREECKGGRARVTTSEKRLLRGGSYRYEGVIDNWIDNSYLGVDIKVYIIYFLLLTKSLPVTTGKDFVSKRKYIIVYSLFNFNFDLYVFC